MSNIFPIVSGAMAHNSASQPTFESSLGDGGSKLVKFAQKFTDPDTSAQKSLEIAKNRFNSHTIEALGDICCNIWQRLPHSAGSINNKCSNYYSDPIQHHNKNNCRDPIQQLAGTLAACSVSVVRWCYPDRAVCTVLTPLEAAVSTVLTPLAAAVSTRSNTALGCC